ncbi:MAG TPA: hypothetical protein VHQ02_08980 [Usitatibacter sp.]|jgi:hypothetical protein|nr:hypothetical protein [Usitatibacter sp.]
MNDDPSDAGLDPARSSLLDLRLDVLRRGAAAEAAPDHLEAALVARFRDHARARRWQKALMPLAAAAVVALVAWIVRAPIPAQPRPALAEESDGGPFLALRPLDAVALERGVTVVAAQFPRALLAEWGLPVAPDRAAEPVHAEMLYSAAGEPLAVRLVR